MMSMKYQDKFDTGEFKKQKLYSRTECQLDDLCFAGHSAPPKDTCLEPFANYVTGR